MRPVKFIQMSDIRRAIGSYYRQAGLSWEESVRLTPSREQTLGLSLNRGTKIHDRVSGQNGEVLYGSRKTIAVHRPRGRGG